MKPHVLSLGGSLVVPDMVDTNFLISFLETLKSLIKQKHRFIVFVGGGKVCRNYIAAHQAVVAAFGKKERTESSDWIGISMTRTNATLLAQMAKGCGIRVCDRLVQSPKTRLSFKNYDVAFGHGEVPGHSTDYGAVVCAHSNKISTIYNLTNVSYVYSKNPKLADAKPLPDLTWKEYMRVCGVKKWIAGLNLPFDPIASSFAMKHRQTVYILDPRKKDVLKKLLSMQIAPSSKIHP